MPVGEQRVAESGADREHPPTLDIPHARQLAQPLNDRILRGLASLPGVRNVAATDDPDLAGDDETGDVLIAGYKEYAGEDMVTEQPLV